MALKLGKVGDTACCSSGETASFAMMRAAGIGAHTRKMLDEYSHFKASTTLVYTRLKLLLAEIGGGAEQLGATLQLVVRDDDPGY